MSAMMDTILFDLDGTLLPLDQQEFTRTYFSLLARKLAPLGYEKNKLIETVWAGSAAMVRNDGSRSNRERFWETFHGVFGYKAEAEPLADEFYGKEFDAVRQVLHAERDLAPLLAALREKGFTLILATNPLFPLVAIRTRLRWLNLREEDFAFITSYENSRYCKPNLDYYRALLRETGREPTRCLMVGNNVQEDMCAANLGASVYLVTDFLENPDGADISAYPHGNFAELETYLRSL